MTTKSTFHRLVLTGGILLGALTPAVARAEDLVEAPKVENAPNTFVGQVNSSNVYVRSGPSTTRYYATTRLDKGDEVTVVGIRDEWLKIQPPKGSYSLVPRAFVNRRGSGDVGRVTQSKPVRAGSTMTPLNNAVQTKVEEGQDVQILGEQNEFYKIVPPPGAYLYIKKDFVDPVRRVPSGGDGQLTESSNTTNPSDIRDIGFEGSGTASRTGGGQPRATTNGSNGPDDIVAGATTVPSDGAAAADFNELESRFEQASRQPLLSQPVDELLKAYQQAVESKDLPTPQRRLAEARIAALKTRAQAVQQDVAFRKSQEELKQRTLALAAEQEEIEARINQNPVDLYAAVGTLRTSSLQRGAGTLYRLTDPANGRTIAYIRSSEPRFAKMVDQFVGVRGEVATDSNLNQRVIAPTEVKGVDPKKVNNSVVAQIVPPSMASASANLRSAGE